VDGDINAASTSGSALIDLLTSGGNSAVIMQGAASTISADGADATVTVRAGSGAVLDAAQLAALGLGGALGVNATQGDATLVVDGSEGSMHDFNVTAAAGNASAQITAYSPGGNLALNGAGTVRANNAGDSGALLAVAAAGALDTNAATLLVDNDHIDTDAYATAEFSANLGSSTIGSLTIESGGVAELIATASAGLTATDLAMSGNTASAELSATTGTVTLGAMTLTGTHGADLYAAALGGNLTQQSGTSLTIAAPAGAAQANLIASGAVTLRDITMTGAIAALAATAQSGALTLTTGTTQQTAASGTSAMQFVAAGPININGDVALDSSAGSALLGMFSGDGSALNQAAASTIDVSGVTATALLQAGEQQTSALALGGTVQLQAGNGNAALTVLGGSGSVHDFSVASSGGAASAEIVSSGTLLLDGSGAVSGHHNSAHGAMLSIDAADVLNQFGSGLTVSNSHNGAQAGASAALTSGGAMNNGSNIAVDAVGGGVAAMTLHTGGELQIDSNLLATAHNTGAGLGSASIVLTSGDQADDEAAISQGADSEIFAISNGNAAGDASVLIQAGHCCDSTVELLGETTAEVDGGTGTASITVRGNEVEVQKLTAKVVNAGSGDSLIDLAAPTSLAVNALLTSQAADSAAQAGIKLITNSLSYAGPNAALSNGNGHVQLAPFTTSWMIGVESEPDFDATPTVNYNMALMQKFTGNNAKLQFGGEYDRSPWIDANGDVCVPGMDGWADMDQHTGDIHVAGAGNGHLQLVASSMEFDTTGTTYYHDNAMSPWSVPTGRTAIYVPRPTPSLDRYVDRTDNSLQQPITGLESAAANPLYVQPAAVVPEGTLQIAGDMFMAGDGVNMSRVDIDDGSAMMPQSQGVDTAPQSEGADIPSQSDGSGASSQSEEGASSNSDSNPNSNSNKDEDDDE
jgi:hypothetical protein